MPFRSREVCSVVDGLDSSVSRTERASPGQASLFQEVK